MPTKDKSLEEKVRDFHGAARWEEIYATVRREGFIYSREFQITRYKSKFHKQKKGLICAVDMD